MDHAELKIEKRIEITQLVLIHSPNHILTALTAHDFIVIAMAPFN